MYKVINNSNNIVTGSSDYDIAWDVASYQWVRQITIQLGKTMYDGSDVKWDPNFSGEVYLINNPPD